MIPTALLSRLAIIGITTLATTVVPWLVMNRPVARFVWDRLGPRVVDRATDVIVDTVGPPLPEVRPDCPACPATPAVDVDVAIPEPDQAPTRPLPVRVVDAAVDTTVTVVDKSVTLTQRILAAAEKLLLGR